MQCQLRPRPSLGLARSCPAPAALRGCRPALHRSYAARRACLRVSAAAAPVSQSVEIVEFVSFKEEARKGQRVVFDPDRWVKHRSTDRYSRHFLALPLSSLARGLAGPLLYVVSLATFLAWYETSRAEGTLPPLTLLGTAYPWPDLSLSNVKELFGFSSFALALLLQYRTSASYERWDGARKMWGLVLNRSRDFTRQALAWFPEEEWELKAMACRWVPAFSKTLMCHLRKGEVLEKELQGILLPHEIEAVLKATHRPNYVMQVLGSIINDASKNGLQWSAAVRMEENITAFEDCLGGCERILRTPIPLLYTRHTSRFLMIWLTFLPFVLWSTCGWSTIPLSTIIAFLLLGIEEIGVNIEEPFSVLALAAISNTALANVQELQMQHGMEPLEAGGLAEDSLSAPEVVALGAYWDGTWWSRSQE